MANEQIKKSVLQRLRTIKGHIAGIEKMVEEDNKCEDILFQLSAVMGAMNKLSANILEGYIDDAVKRKRVEDLTKTMIKMLKR